MHHADIDETLPLRINPVVRFRRSSTGTLNHGTFMNTTVIAFSFLPVAVAGRA